MELVLLALGILVLGGFLSLAFSGDRKGWCVVGTAFLAAPLLLISAFRAIFSAPLALALHLSFPLGTVLLQLDALSGLFVLVAAVIYPLAVVFAVDYLRKHHEERIPLPSHWLFLPLFMTAMNLVFLARQVIPFMLAWEAMSLTSLFLMSLDHHHEEVRSAAVNYFTAMHVGVVMLLLGFTLLWQVTGSQSFSRFEPGLTSSVALPVFLLLLGGFGTKAGLFPFHTWLPKAHPAAPSHVSGLMSGVMIETGIYGIARTIAFTGPDSRVHGTILAVVAIVTACHAVILAASARNLKTLLACSSIENMGILALGLAAGMLGLSAHSYAAAALGFCGALFQMLGHALFKSGLFFSAGAIHNHARTYDLEKLGGLGRRLPAFSGLMLLFSMAISGMPLLAGLPGKLAIYLGLIDAAMPADVVRTPLLICACMLLAFCSAAAAMVFLKAYGAVFLGPGPEKTPDGPVPGAPAMASFYVSAGLLVLLGMVPWLGFSLVLPAALVLVPGSHAFAATFLSELPLAELTGLFVFFLVLALGLARVGGAFSRVPVPQRAPTWGCGFAEPNSRMHYSAHSFSAPFTVLFGKLSLTREKLTRPVGMFPERASFESTSADLADEVLVKTPLRWLLRFLDLFAWIQGADARKYILYGIVFLIVSLIWIMSK